jgi:hypothetical protein
MTNSRTIVACVALVVMVAACGSEGGDGSPGVASIGEVVTTSVADVGADDEPAAADEAAVLAFSECMRDGGIDFPDPVVDADGNVGFDLLAMRDLGEIDQSELEAAFEPCAPLLVSVSFGFERLFETEFQDDLVAFSACMRENGFDMPDPDFSALTSTGQLYPEELDPNDPDFEPAFEACQDTLPGIPGISSP